MVSVHIGHRTHGAKLQIPCHQSGRHRAPSLQRPGRLVGAGGSGGIRHHVEILHLIRQEFHGRRRIARCHKGRSQRNKAAVRFPVSFIPTRIHRPEAEHIGNRSHHADTAVGLGKTVGNGAKQLSVNIHRTAAHALGDTAGRVNDRARHLHQHQIPACGPFILHDTQHIHIKSVNLRAVHHRFRIPMHAFLHIGKRKKLLRCRRQDAPQRQAHRKGQPFYFLACNRMH